MRCCCHRSIEKIPKIKVIFYYTYRPVQATICLRALQWRHNGRNIVSNHQLHDCLLSRLFRRRSKKTSKLLVTGLCAGNSPGLVNSQHKWQVMRNMFPCDDVSMNIARYRLFKKQNTSRMRIPLREVLDVINSCNNTINPLRAKFFRGNINIYLHFVSFIHFDTTPVVEILPQIRQELTYST